MEKRIRDRGTEADWDIHRGTSFTPTFVYEVGGSPRSLVNFDISMKVWNSPPLKTNVPNKLLFEATEANGRIKVPAPGQGVFQIKLTPTETKELPFQTAHYRIQADIQGVDDNLHFLSGKLIVK